MSGELKLCYNIIVNTYWREESSIRQILLVCTGNTCRSSMASALLKDLMAKQDLLNQFKISSAGLAAQTGSKASHFAIQVMEEEGLNLNSHQATQLTTEAIDEADLILTMTNGHKKIILQIVPNARGKVFTLKEFIGNSLEDWEVLDPYGQSLDTYRQCGAELKDLLEKLVKKLKEHENNENSYC